MPSVKRKKKRLPLLKRALAVFENYTIAGVAGAGVILSLLLVVLWAGGYFAMLSRAVDRATGAATASAGLRVNRVLLRGAHQTAHDEVLAALGDLVGEPLVKVSLGEARARVEALGWVRAAAVTRLMPDTIIVAIRERSPAAVWQVSEALHLIDASGAIIRAVSAFEYSNLPLIVGAGAPEAAAALLTALEAHDALRKRTYALIRVGERRWDLRLRNETDIKLPETGFEKAIADIALMHAAQGTLDQPFEYIDLRDPERSVFRPRADAEAGLGAETGAGGRSSAAHQEPAAG